MPDTDPVLRKNQAMFRPVLRFPVCSDVHYTALDLESGEGCLSVIARGGREYVTCTWNRKNIVCCKPEKQRKNELHIVQLVFVYQKKRTA